MTRLKLAAVLLLLLQCISERGTDVCIRLYLSALQFSGHDEKELFKYAIHSESDDSTYDTEAIETAQVSEQVSADNVYDVLQQMGILVDDTLEEEHDSQKRYQEVKRNEETLQGAANSEEEHINNIRALHPWARAIHIVDDDPDIDTNTDQDMNVQERRGVVIKGQRDGPVKQPINVINNEIYIPKSLWNKYIREGKINLINNMINVYLPQPIDVPGDSDEYHANLPSGPITIQVGEDPASLGNTQMEEGKSVLPSVVLGRLARKEEFELDEESGNAESGKREFDLDILEHQKEAGEVE